MTAKKKKLEDRVAIVTGASRGIGEAVARAYADHGAKVVVVSRNLKDIESLVAKSASGHNMLPVSTDITQEDQVSDLVKKTMNHFGKIDILINNAGILTPKAPIHEVRVEDWDITMDVNLKGSFLCTKYVLPVMIQRKSGLILYVSSAAGKREAPEWGPYAVSKFGVEGLSRVVAAEAKSHGIRVNAIDPGGVRTTMRAMAYPGENPMLLLTPEEVTPLFVYLASSDARNVTGQSIAFRDWTQSFPDVKCYQ